MGFTVGNAPKNNKSVAKKLPSFLASGIVLCKVRSIDVDGGVYKMTLGLATGDKESQIKTTATADTSKGLSLAALLDECPFADPQFTITMNTLPNEEEGEEDDSEKLYAIVGRPRPQKDGSVLWGGWLDDGNKVEPLIKWNGEVGDQCKTVGNVEVEFTSMPPRAAYTQGRQPFPAKYEVQNLKCEGSFHGAARIAALAVAEKLAKQNKPTEDTETTTEDTETVKSGKGKGKGKGAAE